MVVVGVFVCLSFCCCCSTSSLENRNDKRSTLVETKVKFYGYSQNMDNFDNIFGTSFNSDYCHIITDHDLWKF